MNELLKAIRQCCMAALRYNEPIYLVYAVRGYTASLILVRGTKPCPPELRNDPVIFLATPEIALPCPPTERKV